MPCHSREICDFCTIIIKKIYIQSRTKSNCKKIIPYILKCIFMFTRRSILCDIKSFISVVKLKIDACTVQFRESVDNATIKIFIKF